jgi:hypothetical protein
MPDLVAAKGGAPQPFSNAFRGAKINSLRYNTAQKGSPVAVCYGTQRVSVNVIGGFGFTASSGGGKKGGKGGGGKGGSKKGSGQFYSVNVAFGLCQGPISFSGAPYGFSGNNRVWANGGVAGTDAVPVNYYIGSDGQAVDPVFASSSGDPPLLGYSGTAYVTGTPLYLGSSPVLPNVQVEITGFGAGTAGPNFVGDARPDWIVVDMLTNVRYGAGFPIANLDTGGGWGAGGSVADWGDYCQAAQLAMSYVADRQQPVARWIEEIAQLTVSAVVWSGATLKIIPYADGALSANGATWTPNLTWQYSLIDDDFIPWSEGGGSDPVIIARSDPSREANWLGAEYEDAAGNYNREVIPVWDQGAIDEHGIRAEPSVQADAFTNVTSTTISAQLQLQRKLYVRNIYKFKLGWRYSLLEPMDIVLLTDAALGLVGAAVRITQIDEDDNGELTVTAEEIPGVTP